MKSIEAMGLGDILSALCPKERVLYFAPCASGVGIGGSARLDAMVDLLVKSQRHVYVISYSPSEHFGVKRIPGIGWDYVEISVNRQSSQWLKALAIPLMLLYSLPYVFRVRRVFAHAPSICSGFPALIISRLFRKPIVIDHMDIKDPQTPAWLFRYILKSADVVFCISKFLQRDALYVNRKKVVYLPNWVDTEKFKSATLE